MQEINELREELKSINAFKRVRNQIQDQVNDLRERLNEER